MFRPHHPHKARVSAEMQVSGGSNFRKDLPRVYLIADTVVGTHEGSRRNLSEKVRSQTIPE